MEDSKIGRIEDKLEVVLDRLAEHVSQCHEHWKAESSFVERLIKLEALLSQIEWKEIGKLDARLGYIERLKDSGWGIMAPVLSSLIGGLIVWIATVLLK